MFVKSLNEFLNEKKYEISKQDGEWALVNTTNSSCTLFGPKEDLEKVLNSIQEGAVPEGFIVPSGMKGDVYTVTINGHEYGYVAKENSPLTIEEIGAKFVRMTKFSLGKAFAWFKKNTELSTGSKKNESEDFAMFNFINENISSNEIKPFDMFFESKSQADIEELGIDMLDFYGGEVPENPIEYFKAREFDKELVDKIHVVAMMLAADGMSEGLKWEDIAAKKSDEIHTELKAGKYSAKELEKIGNKATPEEQKEFTKALKKFNEEKAKEKEGKGKEESKEDKNKIEKQDIQNKIDKLTKEQSNPETSEERKMKISNELTKLDKKIKSL
jgi:hypothetical protein